MSSLNKLKSKYSYFALLSLFLIPCISIFSNPVIINENFSNYSLGKKLFYYIDSTNKLTIEDVAQDSFRENFIFSNTHDPNFGFQDSSFWVMFEIKNERTKKNNFYIEQAFPPFDFIEVYYPEENNFQVITLGDNYPFHHRKIKHRNHLALVPIPPLSSKTIYMKLNTKSVMALRLTLHDESSISMKTSVEQFFFGMYYGIIIVLFFTNLFLFFSLKEKLYLFYLSFIFSLGMYFFVFNGFGFAILWPNSIYWNDIANPFFMSLTAITGARTSIHFLNLSDYSITVKKVLDGISILVFFNLIFLFILPYKYCLYYLYFLIAPMAIGIFSATIISLIRKNPLAKFFLLGFFSFLLSGVFTTLNNLGVLPGYISPDIMQMASGLSIVILSVGLGHRYYLLKQKTLEIESKSIQINSKLKKIQDELEIAKRIHESLLPAKIPISKNIRIHAKYLPSGEIGGDFYDFLYLEDNCLGVFIADVTGHGVPAALFASTVKFSLSRETKFLRKPAKLLGNINSSLFEKIGNNFLSAGYFCLDLNLRTVTYASCGHPPLLIWKTDEKEFIELKPKGRLIGVYRDIVLHDTVYQLDIGDRILFYTDGLIECENSDGIPFSEKALYRFTLQNEHLPAEEFATALVKSLNEFSATPGKFNDDVTFIVIDIV